MTLEFEILSMPDNLWKQSQAVRVVIGIDKSQKKGGRNETNYKMRFKKFKD